MSSAHTLFLEEQKSIQLDSCFYSGWASTKLRASTPVRPEHNRIRIAAARAFNTAIDMTCCFDNWMVAWRMRARVFWVENELLMNGGGEEEAQSTLIYIYIRQWSPMASSRQRAHAQQWDFYQLHPLFVSSSKNLPKWPIPTDQSVFFVLWVWFVTIIKHYLADRRIHFTRRAPMILIRMAQQLNILVIFSFKYLQQK